MAQLPANREAYCQAYIITLNKTQAAKDAGYSAKSAHIQGSRLHRNAEVRVRIDELMEKRMAMTQLSQLWVLEKIRTCIEESIEEKDRPSTLRGCELLGRHFKMWVDKVEFSTGYENMTPEELDRALAKEQSLNAQAIDQDVSEVH